MSYGVLWYFYHIIVVILPYTDRRYYCSPQETFNTITNTAIYKNLVFLRYYGMGFAYYNSVPQALTDRLTPQTPRRIQTMAKGWTNKLDETNELIHRSDIPSMWLSLEDALSTFGGWSKFFSKSSTTYDMEVIKHRESDPGFWVEYGKAKAVEQFEIAVADACKEFRACYPAKKIKIKELRKLLAGLLLEDGWKPVKAPILREIRDLKRKKKEEIKALRGGRTKKEWLKHLRTRRTK